jgi:predicted alpha/beta-hydrolase family hydrolase
VNDRWFLFAHGAGAPSTSPWMVRWKHHLAELGEVVTFDYPYMRDGRKTPDPFPKLLDAHKRAMRDALGAHSSPPILIGKSMGSRIGCHLSLEEPARALICLGYPLKAPGGSGRLRDEVLRELTTPILFVQGTRDALCPLETLEEVRSEMRAPSRLHVVETGDHSLVATKTHLKKAGTTQEALEAQILETIRAFLTT